MPVLGTASGSGVSLADKGTWATTTAYAVGDVVTYAGQRYAANTAHTAAAAFTTDTAKWTALGAPATDPTFTGHVTVPSPTNPADAVSLAYAAANFTATGSFNDIRAYGAKVDTQSVNDAAITTGTATLTSATAAFTSLDTGKTFNVIGAGAAGANLVTTGTYVNATTITLAANAGATVSGARMQWGTDDTAAVRAAITAAFTGGSGTVYFPPGVTLLASPAITGTGGGGYAYAGQLLIPARPLTGKPITIQFLGSIPQTQVFWGAQTGDVMDVEQTGSIVQSVATSGNILDVIPHATASAVNAADYWSNINVEMSNLCWRAPNNPAIGGLNLRKAICANIDRTTIGVNATTASLAQPTHGTIALALPDIDNDARGEFRRSQVYGFGTGITHSEHAVLDDASIYHCIVGIAPQAAYHLSKYSKVGIWRCVTGVQPAGNCNIVGEIAFEGGTATGWPTGQADIDDPSGYINGDLKVCRYSQSRLIIRGLFNCNVTNVRQIGGGTKPSLQPWATYDGFSAGNSGSGYAVGQMDSGQTWGALGSGVGWGVGFGKAYLTSVGLSDCHLVVPLYHPTLNLANYTVQADITLSGTKALAGLVIHANAANFYIAASLRKYGANNFLRLERNVSGTYTTLQDAMTGTLANSSTYTLTVNVTPTTITVSVNGTTQITYTKTGTDQTNFNAQPRAGLYAFGSGAEDGGSRWGNFSIV